MTFLLSQQFEKAVEDFTTFIRFDNKVVDHVNRHLHLMMKDTTRAYEDYNTAIRTNWRVLGLQPPRDALHGPEKYDEALADFDKSIECDSTYILLLQPGTRLFDDQPSGAGNEDFSWH